MTKDMPHDVTSEELVLACILSGSKRVSDLTDRVNIDDFWVPKHRVILACMVELAAQHYDPTMALVTEALNDRGQLAKIGGIGAVYALNDKVPVGVLFDDYIKRITTKSNARKMIVAAREVLIMARTMADIDPVAFVETARARIAKVENRVAKELEAVNIKDLIGEVMQDVSLQKEPAGLIKTCLAGIDLRTGGLWPGLLTVVAGRPGMGKSAFVQNIIQNVARNEKRVLHITLEDIPYFVGVRYLARFGDVDNTLISMRSVSTDDLARLQAVVNQHEKLNHWVIGASGVSSNELRAAVLRHKDKHGLDFLVVDHLAEIREEAENETQAVSKAARAARDLAMELNIPALYAHQLNRKVEDRVDKRPTMSDLKQSGKIEEVARNVWFLYRDGYYAKNEERHDAQLIISKANHGRTGMVKLWADLSRMHYRDWDDMKDGHFPKQPGVAADGTSDESGPARKRKAALKTGDMAWMGEEMKTPYLDYNEVAETRNDFD